MLINWIDKHLKGKDFGQKNTKKLRKKFVQVDSRPVRTHGITFAEQRARKCWIAKQKQKNAVKQSKSVFFC